MKSTTAICSITKKELPIHLLHKGDDLRKGIIDLIKANFCRNEPAIPAHSG